MMHGQKNIKLCRCIITSQKTTKIPECLPRVTTVSYSGKLSFNPLCAYAKLPVTDSHQFSLASEAEADEATLKVLPRRDEGL